MRRILSRVAVLAPSLILIASESTQGQSISLPEPAPVSEITVDALKAALRSDADPQHLKSDRLSISKTGDPDRLRVQGRCSPSARVVLSGRGVKEATVVPCRAGKYSADLGQPVGSAEIIATQTFLNGTIISAETGGPAIGAPTDPIHPLRLDGAVLETQPNRYIRLEPGLYSNFILNLSGAVDSAAPIVIDGAGLVTFTGMTRLRVSRGVVTLTGLRFEDTPAGTLIVDGPFARITNSQFSRCGDVENTKADCIFVSPSAHDTEIDNNTFSGSPSMTIKIRAGTETDTRHPTNAYIHHNVFRDIRRASENGQEPIQLAGPGGGGAKVPFHARIEHNLFIRAEGDREAISVKTPNNRIRWNVFYDMDAAPNLRGSHENELTGNLLIRSRPIRVAGRSHTVHGNLVLCPNRSFAIGLSDGSANYANATGNRIVSNLFVVEKVGVQSIKQEKVTTALASENEVRGNIVITTRGGVDTKVSPDVNNVSDNKIVGVYEGVCGR